MMSMLQALEHELLSAGYLQRGSAIFEAPDSHRLVALMEASDQTADWFGKVDTALRNESFRMAATWSRYLIVIVNFTKTTNLAAAAAAFCRDVSKCRRLVAFTDQLPRDVLPFLPLRFVPRGAGTPGNDVETIAARNFESSVLAATFLDDHAPTTLVQSMAEQPESQP